MLSTAPKTLTLIQSLRLQPVEMVSIMMETASPITQKTPSVKRQVTSMSVSPVRRIIVSLRSPAPAALTPSIRLITSAALESTAHSAPVRKQSSPSRSVRSQRSSSMSPMMRMVKMLSFIPRYAPSVITPRVKSHASLQLRDRRSLEM